MDRESQAPLCDSEISEILAAFDTALPSLDALILQDYNKGVLTAPVIERALAQAKKRGIPVSVDPKFDNFMRYTGAHLFKPNLREAERALGLRISDDATLEEACGRASGDLEPDVLMVTRGERGMTICTRHDRTTIPTHARDVADVSGAGDTVISTFVACEMGGGKMIEAATLANIAAGIVCEQVGVVPIDKERLALALERAE
ncbi:MAG: hypothetical protein IPG71_11420 [bacterium]|nr:hypothetical protein [bacterium]